MERKTKPILQNTQVMTQEEIEKHLQSALASATPDIWSKLDLSVPQEQPGRASQIGMVSQSETASQPAQSDKIRDRKRSGILLLDRRLSGLTAAACVGLLLVGGGSAYHYEFLQTACVVGLDVNPSVSLSLNRRDRVLKAEADNSDGEVLLQNTSLKGQKVDTAVAQVVDELLNQGYFKDQDQVHAILVSVTNSAGTKEKAEQIRETVSSHVELTLNEKQVDAVVYDQTVEVTPELEELAKQYQVSVGKAGFVDQLVKTNESLDEQDPASYTKMMSQTMEEIQQEISSNSYALEPGTRVVHAEPVKVDSMTKERNDDSDKDTGAAKTAETSKTAETFKTAEVANAAETVKTAEAANIAETVNAAETAHTVVADTEIQAGHQAENQSGHQTENQVEKQTATARENTPAELKAEESSIVAETKAETAAESSQPETEETTAATESKVEESTATAESKIEESTPTSENKAEETSAAIETKAEAATESSQPETKEATASDEARTEETTASDETRTEETTEPDEARTEETTKSAEHKTEGTSAVIETKAETATESSQPETKENTASEGHKTEETAAVSDTEAEGKKNPDTAESEINQADEESETKALESKETFETESQESRETAEPGNREQPEAAEQETTQNRIIYEAPEPEKKKPELASASLKNSELRVLQEGPGAVGLLDVADKIRVIPAPDDLPKPIGPTYGGIDWWLYAGYTEEDLKKGPAVVQADWMEDEEEEEEPDTQGPGFRQNTRQNTR